jgi:hypothetical protein
MIESSEVEKFTAYLEDQNAQKPKVPWTTAVAEIFLFPQDNDANTLGLRLLSKLHEGTFVNIKINYDISTTSEGSNRTIIRLKLDNAPDGNDTPRVTAQAESQNLNRNLRRLRRALENVLGRLPEIDNPFKLKIDRTICQKKSSAVAIYNVGQGNCNALIDKNEVPHVFFDLGEAGLKSTFASKKFRLNPSLKMNPPVILSHWDYDHWAIAKRIPNTKKLLWIAPDQGALRIRSADFAKGLIRDKKLKIIRTPGVKFVAPGIFILKLALPGKFNNSGLVTLVELGAKNHPKRVLLPGDASYARIISAQNSWGAGLAGLNASHHGGIQKPAGIFVSPDRKGRFYAVSVGKHKRYKHPSASHLKGLSRRQWGNNLNTHIEKNLAFTTDKNREQQPQQIKGSGKINRWIVL